MKKPFVALTIFATLLICFSCKKEASTTTVEGIPEFMKTVADNGPSCGSSEFVDLTINGKHFQINYDGNLGPKLCNTLSVQATYQQTLFGKIMPIAIPLNEFFNDYPIDSAQAILPVADMQLFMVFDVPKIADLQTGEYKVQKNLGWKDLPGAEFFINLDFWEDTHSLYQYTLASSPEGELKITSIEHLPDQTTKICGYLKGRLVPAYDYCLDYTFDIEGTFSYILQ